MACGPKQPEPAPAYKPVNSPEAPTSCPELWTRAKKAREAVLENGNQFNQTAAAIAVYGHAECERAQLDAMKLVGPTHDQLLGQIRRARAQYNTTRNLYKEAGNYTSAPYAVGARVRLGELHARFADLLRRISTPRDMTSTQERGAFLSELSTLAAGFDREAVHAFAEAINEAKRRGLAGTTDDRLKRWLTSACKNLAVLAPDNAARKTCESL